ncbi:DUF418 domain-containing protein [Salinispirillum sp. LH 10-3-1]|uniref:DUF418 domain-containing protein n=1 Tax=Salinispirillum sp. LH 10-3-1 TaxID=2952525 RepID=A0AB38YHL7_9GAMM
MAASTYTLTAQPRIESLDVLRGVAVLGIFFLNIYAFAVPEMWFYYPASVEHWSIWDQWVMWFTLTFGAEKFLTMLSVLFGGSVALFASRSIAYAELTQQHRRRMAVLATLGLLHAYGLWFGDILFHYALCGFIIWWLRDLHIRTQAILAAVLLSVPPLLSLLVVQSVPHWTPEQRVDFLLLVQANPAQVQQEIAAYTSGWLQQWPQRSGQAWESHTEVLLGYTLWRTLGLMLIGGMLVRLGWLNAAAVGRYRAVCLGALLAGTLLSGYGAATSIWYASNTVTEHLLQPLLNYFGSLLMAIGYMWLVVIWGSRTPHQNLTRRVNSVGRLALSVYLLQTLVATTLFYGHGFAQFGQWPPVALVAMVIVFTGLTLLGAAWWLNRFNQGPMEWLWRRCSYRAAYRTAK